MPLKILHTADNHLGAKFLSLGRKGVEQRARLLEAFDETVNLAIRENVDMFLAAGDLFDSPGVSRSLLGRVAFRFQDLAAKGIAIVVSPGTHDPYGDRSIWRAAELRGIDNLSIFKSEEMARLDLPELDCTVYGNANVKPFANKRPLAGFKPSDDSRYRIGVLHSSFEIPDVVDDTYIVSAAEVRECGLDYIALGHYHSLSDRSAGGVSCYYPGSPEMVRMQKSDTGNVLLVEIDNGKASVTPCRVGRLSYEELVVKAEDAGAAGLVTMIESKADVEKVLNLVVEGVRRPGFPDIGEILSSISEMFFHVTCTDRSFAAPSALDPLEYPEGSPARLYIQSLKDRLPRASKSEKEEILDAMQIGLWLLQEGAGR